MSFLKKLFGGGKSADGFDAFVEASMEGLQVQTAAHQGTWHLGDEERWDFEQASGMLVFTFANQSIADPLKRDSLRVLDYGKQHGIAKLTTAKWPGAEMDGWRMAALANRLCASNGAYRGPAGTTLVFLTFGEIQLSKRQ